MRRSPPPSILPIRGGTSVIGYVVTKTPCPKPSRATLVTALAETRETRPKYTSTNECESERQKHRSDAEIRRTSRVASEITGNETVWVIFLNDLRHVGIESAARRATRRRSRHRPTTTPNPRPSLAGLTDELLRMLLDIRQQVDRLSAEDDLPGLSGAVHNTCMSTSARSASVRSARTSVREARPRAICPLPGAFRQNC